VAVLHVAHLLRDTPQSAVAVGLDARVWCSRLARRGRPALCVELLPARATARFYAWTYTLDTVEIDAQLTAWRVGSSFCSMSGPTEQIRRGESTETHAG
jgi:hypothetical protein